MQKVESCDVSLVDQEFNIVYLVFHDSKRKKLLILLLY